MGGGEVGPDLDELPVPELAEDNLEAMVAEGEVVGLKAVEAPFNPDVGEGVEFVEAAYREAMGLQEG